MIVIHTFWLWLVAIAPSLLPVVFELLIKLKIVGFHWSVSWWCNDRRKSVQEVNCAPEPRGALLGQRPGSLHLGKGAVVEDSSLVGKDNFAAAWVNVGTPCCDFPV